MFRFRVVKIAKAKHVSQVWEDQWNNVIKSCVCLYYTCSQVAVISLICFRVLLRVTHIVTHRSAIVWWGSSRDTRNVLIMPDFRYFYTPLIRSKFEYNSIILSLMHEVNIETPESTRRRMINYIIFKSNTKYQLNNQLEIEDCRFDDLLFFLQSSNWLDLIPEDSKHISLTCTNWRRWKFSSTASLNTEIIMDHVSNLVNHTTRVHFFNVSIRRVNRKITISFSKL